jgi:hypothetical protein
MVCCKPPFKLCGLLGFSWIIGKICPGRTLVFLSCLSRWSSERWNAAGHLPFLLYLVVEGKLMKLWGLIGGCLIV